MNVARIATLGLLVFAKGVGMGGGGVPDGAIEGRDADYVKVAGNPTPERGIAVHTSAFVVFDEEIDESWDEWEAVAG
jgi:hypothetical protein